ncbi:hypothetical protein T484DRAFT_1888288 [Baffinella frigidus]|nr:hypothetical protein T484DRAFT_1888288 [Cryptophyta sp. CCMP2293]
MEAGEARGGDADGEAQAEPPAATPPQAADVEVERDDGASSEDEGVGSAAGNSGESERSADGEAAPGATLEAPADGDPAGEAAPGGETGGSPREDVDDGGVAGESERGGAAGEEGMQADNARVGGGENGGGGRRTVLAAAVAKSEPNEVDNRV